MKKIIAWTAILFLAGVSSSLAKNGEPWIRTNDATLKMDKIGNRLDKASVNTSIVTGNYGANNSCLDDWAVDFDISFIQTIPNFDVDNLYVDSTTYASAVVLNRMLDISNTDNHRGRVLAPLQWGDWSGKKVSFCVGRRVTHSGPHGIGPLRKNIKRDLGDLVIWYKDPNKTTVRNISAADICLADGSNWLQKVLVKYRSRWLDHFCQDFDNKAKITFNTQNDTATLASKIPLKSDGSKTITISFSQAGVTSSQVKSGIGKGYGGNATGGSNGSGAGYDPDPNGDIWAGYVHHVGLKYMKVGKKSSGHWDGSKIWPIDDIPNRRDFRIKLKRKGGVWPDVCAEVWFSHNKYFTDEDWHLKTKCKNLSDSEYDDDNYKSVYVKDVYIPNEMEAGKNYYFFTRVTYSGGVNPSSRDDDDEYAKVEIADFSSKFEMDTVIGEVPLGVAFTNKSNVVHGSITSYLWSFGDGTTSSEENPVHIYENPGTYTITLTTTANWGAQKTSHSKLVTVLEPEDQGLSVAEKMEILW